MHAARQPGANHDAKLPAPALTSVLADLGHDCPGACTTATAELGAQLWFIGRGPARTGRCSAALVVVDASAYDGSVVRYRQLMRTINDCLWPDGIRMSQRRLDDSGLALAMVRPVPPDAVDSRAPATSRRLIRTLP